MKTTFTVMTDLSGVLDAVDDPIAAQSSADWYRVTYFTMATGVTRWTTTEPGIGTVHTETTVEARDAHTIIDVHFAAGALESCR